MKYVLFFLLMAPVYSFAAIDVAFIELRGHDGQLVQLEPNGRFAHVAISYQGGWLHSHPCRGVEVISEDALEKMGSIKAIITIPDLNPLDETQVEKFLGKPYDHNFLWGDDKIYCAELFAKTVGKLLNIHPQPMTFASEFWPRRFWNFRGELGISPDDIFLALKQKGYRERGLLKNCSKLLSTSTIAPALEF